MVPPPRRSAQLRAKDRPQQHDPRPPRAASVPVPRPAYARDAPAASGNPKEFVDWADVATWRRRLGDGAGLGYNVSMDGGERTSNPRVQTKEAPTMATATREARPLPRAIRRGLSRVDRRLRASGLIRGLGTVAL